MGKLRVDIVVNGKKYAKGEACPSGDLGKQLKESGWVEEEAKASEAPAEMPEPRKPRKKQLAE